jgi:hypothetical protein
MKRHSPTTRRTTSKPRRQMHWPKRTSAADSLIIEFVYEPDIERQMAGLCIPLGTAVHPTQAEGGVRTCPEKRNAARLLAAVEAADAKDE